jgi:hypothetical protein
MYSAYTALLRHVCCRQMYDASQTKFRACNNGRAPVAGVGLKHAITKLKYKLSICFAFAACFVAGARPVPVRQTAGQRCPHCICGGARQQQQQQWRLWSQSICSAIHTHCRYYLRTKSMIYGLQFNCPGRAHLACRQQQQHANFAAYGACSSRVQSVGLVFIAGGAAVWQSQRRTVAAAGCDSNT